MIFEVSKFIKCKKEIPFKETQNVKLIFHDHGPEIKNRDLEGFGAAYFPITARKRYN